MSWITVETNADADVEKLTKAIGELKGVDVVSAEGDDPEYLLREIGERLWELEDMNSLDCPLRDMRQAIEGLLREDFRCLPKKFDETLGRPCDWCAENRE
jgi:aminoglycoside phosphotransferase